MNDVEEAIEEMKHTKKFYSSENSFELAIEALEKQVPKKPGMYSDDYETWLECPVCSETVPEYTSENKTECYCVGCGQKLKWGSESDE